MTHPLYDFTGRTALVTGGGAGMGEAAVRTFAEAGANVAILDRDAVAAAPAPSRVQASLVHFMPGSRTHWHSHPLSQTVFVTEGVGLCQRRGGPVEVIRPGAASSSKPMRSTGTARPPTG
ncbi:hypothetical protein GCM10027060_22610 [Nesterenkonia halophila]|uniref:SDR family NAD(P)-dependent oxidoreductase n=1 Tax=Nesterenkonia halophila TaxID=302044 RepID=UPI001FEC3D0D|nr:SDR family NAD(P)-dependent oxidoreductase [Nesterenkonia halophila]